MVHGHRLWQTENLQMPITEETDLLNGMAGSGGMDTADSSLGMTATGVRTTNSDSINTNSNSMTVSQAL